MQKSAFLLPAELSYKFAKITSITNKDVVSVSKEHFVNVSYSIQIERHVNRLYIRKMGYMKESGIPEWLPTVIKYMSKYVSTGNETPKSASLQGNVPMIFIIMCAGYVLAFTSFIAERSKSFWEYYGKSFWNRKLKIRSYGSFNTRIDLTSISIELSTWFREVNKTITFYIRRLLNCRINLCK